MVDESSVPSQQLVVAGKITSVYGIKGWVKVYSWTQPRENIFDYTPWYLDTGQGLKEIEIDDFRPQGQGLVAHIKGVDDRDQAREYCQLEVRVDRGEFPELHSGEFYWHQLRGLKVYGGLAEKRQLLGEVGDMMETGANDVLVVKPTSDSVDKRERLVPFVASQFNTEVDLDKGTITLDWDPDFE
jgi:16S rRNA processing protein RimM